MKNLREVEYLVDVLPRWRRRESDRHMRQAGKGRLDVLRHFAGRHGNHQVPLVDDENGRLVLFEDILRELLVHLADGLVRVEEEQDHVGPADGAFRAGEAVKLDIVGQAFLLPHTRRVDGDEHLPVVLEANIDAVARGSGHFADDHPL